MHAFRPGFSIYLEVYSATRILGEFLVEVLLGDFAVGGERLEGVGFDGLFEEVGGDGLELFDG